MVVNMNKQKSSIVFPQVLLKKLDYFARKEKLIESLMSDAELTHLHRGIKELIAAVVSKANNSTSCFNHHFNSMQDHGIDYDLASQVKIDYKSSSLEKRMISLLEFCEELALSAESRSDFDENLKNLISLGWTEEELYEAIIICCEITSLNKIKLALDLKDDFSELNHTRTPIQRERV